MQSAASIEHPAPPTGCPAQPIHYPLWSRQELLQLRQRSMEAATYAYGTGPEGDATMLNRASAARCVAHQRLCAPINT
jgi:hypothetical protein